MAYNTEFMTSLSQIINAARQYVGARYVPRFIDGGWNATQSYEALDVLDNGMGTSYIAKKPVPAGTPLTNREYWFIYGSTSGAILNLQQQINDMKDGSVSGSLQHQINENSTDIDGISLSLSNEQSARYSADNNLQSQITANRTDINTNTSDISAEIAARSASDTAINARIDQIIAPSGEAPSAAEVLDARVGNDGYTYSSLGDAIRTPINNLEDTDSNIRKKTRISLHPIFTASKNLNSSGAYVSTTDDRMACAQFIDVSGSTGIDYNIDIGYKINFCIYSSNSEGSFISQQVWITGSGRFETTGNYIRVGMANASDTTITPAEASHLTLSIDYSLMNDIDNATLLGNEAISALNDETIKIPLTFYQGSGVSFSWNRIKTALIDISHFEKFSIDIDSGVQYYLGYYDEDGTYIVGRGWYNTYGEYVPESARLMLLLAYTDSSNLTPDDYDETMATMRAKISTSGIPTYWNSAISTAIDTINSNECESDAQGDSFVFITDTHWTQNAQRSPKLIKEIMKNTNIDKVFFGGDVLTLYPTKSEALKVGRSFFKEFSDNHINVFSTLGNHDVNNNSPDYGDSAYLSYPDVYSYFFKKMESNVSGMPKYGDTNGDVNKNFYSYLDNDTQKIRYIILNNGRSRIGDTQKQWFQDRITELDTGWTVVVFVHRYWIGLSGDTPVLDGDYGTDIVDAIDEIYITADATVAALIVGHTHYDYSIVTTNGYPVIATTTDAYQLSNQSISPVMTLGTDTEQAFDVFSINTKTRTIKATRIGAGNNRSWSY